MNIGPKISASPSLACLSADSTSTQPKNSFKLTDLEVRVTLLLKILIGNKYLTWNKNFLELSKGLRDYFLTYKKFFLSFAYENFFMHSNEEEITIVNDLKDLIEKAGVSVSCRLAYNWYQTEDLHSYIPKLLSIVKENKWLAEKINDLMLGDIYLNKGNCEEIFKLINRCKFLTALSIKAIESGTTFMIPESLTALERLSIVEVHEGASVKLPEGLATLKVIWIGEIRQGVTITISESLTALKLLWVHVSSSSAIFEIPEGLRLSISDDSPENGRVYRRV